VEKKAINTLASQFPNTDRQNEQRQQGGILGESFASLVRHINTWTHLSSKKFFWFCFVVLFLVVSLNPSSLSFFVFSGFPSSHSNKSPSFLSSTLNKLFAKSFVFDLSSITLPALLEPGAALVTPVVDPAVPVAINAFLLEDAIPNMSSSLVSSIVLGISSNKLADGVVTFLDLNATDEPNKLVVDVSAFLEDRNESEEESKRSRRPVS